MGLLEGLPSETLWRIFVLTDSPRLVYTVLPRVSRKFNAAVRACCVVIQANVDLISEEEEEGASAALLQTPDPPRLLKSFRHVVVPSVAPPTLSPLASPCQSTPTKPSPLGLNPAGTGYAPATPVSTPTLYLSTPVGVSSSGGHPGNGRSDDEVSVIHVAGERLIKVHMNAIPLDNPTILVDYVRELLRRGAAGSGKRSVKIVFGTVQVKGRRGTIAPEVLGGFISAIKPLNIQLWWWDSDLIEHLPSTTAALRLPNMRADGHIQPRDLALLASGGASSLRRLELFRPMPRQPWGLEAGAFAPLSALPKLTELVVRSGRLIGTHEMLTTGVLGINNLSVLELPWSIDSRLGVRLIHGLPRLRRLQYVHVTSPDFFQGLPTFYENAFEVMTAPPGSAVKPIVAANALTSLRALGLNYMEPEGGDLSVMVEGIVRCLPQLKEMVLRINSRQSENAYDFFAIPREQNVGVTQGRKLSGFRYCF
ncbi:hypothetical protein HK101_002851 [Irineochytrium annulatum]|nr:hypothetical protein HK101_002851 [Irineochytrium annulatum]